MNATYSTGKVLKVCEQRLSNGNNKPNIGLWDFTLSVDYGHVCNQLLQGLVTQATIWQKIAINILKIVDSARTPTKQFRCDVAKEKNKNKIANTAQMQLSFELTVVGLVL